MFGEACSVELGRWSCLGKDRRGKQCRTGKEYAGSNHVGISIEVDACLMRVPAKREKTLLRLRFRRRPMALPILVEPRDDRARLGC